MAKNTIMHPHMWGSILKSMTKSIFFIFELKFVCHPFVSDHALRKQVFRNLYIFQSIEGEGKSVPEQVILQPHKYFIVSNNSYYAMMEDIFYCLSTALEDLDLLLELQIVFNHGAEAVLLQGIHANPET